MTDQTVEVLREIAAFAETHGAQVDRVEVCLRDAAEGISVEFTAHLLPAPLKQSTICTGYLVSSDPA